MSDDYAARGEAIIRSGKYQPTTDMFATNGAEGIIDAPHDGLGTHTAPT